jgi:hypothetical protein
MLRNLAKPLLVGIAALVGITVVFSVILDGCTSNQSRNNSGDTASATADGDATSGGSRNGQPAAPVPGLKPSGAAVLGTQIDRQADQRAAESLVLSSTDLSGESRSVEPFITSANASLEDDVATCMGQPLPDTQRSALAESPTWGTDKTLFTSTVEVWIDPKLALDEAARRDSEKFRECVRDSFVSLLTTDGARGTVYKVSKVETREFPLDESGENGSGFEITMLLNDGSTQQLWYLQRHTLVGGRTLTTVWAAEEFRPPRTQLVEQAVAAARTKLDARAVQ